MRLALHGDDLKNGDIIGQNFIQPEKQVEIPFFIDICMKKILTGMHVRISTAAADYRNGFLQYPAHRRFHNFLHT
jgi:hypothetical protein